MARGWESKSVEAQMEQGLGRDERPDAQSLHELELTRKRESLETTRRGVTRDLQTARTEAHRAALQNALSFLDDELAKLR